MNRVGDFDRSVQFLTLRDGDRPVYAYATGARKKG